ncbi:MAG: bifunctional glutamate N-acetyltransferase/amino-acid acetyltransferase ArgJ [Rhodobacteraceae bacterium]|nr:bifunctional glutamate N-acetyltransferase/amino-acid acetyltransferase ArgJ [Paracoccaceae bacterium]MYI91794.1 bifunctional glutamate N-acetyltransferase/amino-acid acetyltransferase ArgJ [Paracoccaceae bacterium]
MADKHVVSPLAPPEGFPDLPLIKGVRLATATAGIKYSRTDVMLASINPVSAVAGVFTQSSTRSAAVIDCERKLHKIAVSVNSLPEEIAILVNSGNANAFTGRAGEEAVREVSCQTAQLLGLDENSVFTASTGVIGEPLAFGKITRVLAELKNNLSENNLEDAGQAIMTTDTFPKGAGIVVDCSDKPVAISGIAKGSGMIAPDMATMLAYVFTDANIDQTTLQSMVSELTETTFNSVSVDGDTSTSDTFMVAATGLARNKMIVNQETSDSRKFKAGLQSVMLSLAQQIARDGEGATKFVEISVVGAENNSDAKKVAKSIANSPLVKTAISGEDPNWGRVVMAVGKSGARADRDLLAIKFGDILVAENGQVADNYKEELGQDYMKKQEILITVDLGLGKGSSRFWTCDFSHGYISINADYRS